jgi:8-oxo-dGTP pyrophosphatase MutT (NUDIX family)
MTNDDTFLDPTTPVDPLSTGTATAAIIITPDGYLLQLRDAIPNIWFPAHWGLFGGAVESGESARDAIVRELQEELTLDIAPKRFLYFTQISFDFRRWGRGIKLRYNFELTLSANELAHAELHEGQEMHVFSTQDMLCLPNLTPYDSHAIRLHAAVALGIAGGPWPSGELQ